MDLFSAFNSLISLSCRLSFAFHCLNAWTGYYHTLGKIQFQTPRHQVVRGKNISTFILHMIVFFIFPHLFTSYNNQSQVIGRKVFVIIKMTDKFKWKPIHQRRLV